MRLLISNYDRLLLITLQAKEFYECTLDGTVQQITKCGSFPSQSNAVGTYHQLDVNWFNEKSYSKF